MGYRSNITMVIHGKEEDVLGLWAQFRLKNPYDNALNDPLGTGSTTIRKEGANAIITFQAEDWKWYGDFPDVQRVEALWDFFNKKQGDEYPLDGIFIRIGENDDDVETRTFGENGLARVRRSIDCDYPVCPDDDVRSKI